MQVNCPRCTLLNTVPENHVSGQIQCEACQQRFNFQCEGFVTPSAPEQAPVQQQQQQQQQQPAQPFLPPQPVYGAPLHAAAHPYPQQQQMYVQRVRDPNSFTSQLNRGVDTMARGLGRVVSSIGRAPVPLATIHVSCPGCHRVIECPQSRLLRCPMCQSDFISPMPKTLGSVAKQAGRDIEYTFNKMTGGPTEHLKQ